MANDGTEQQQPERKKKASNIGDMNGKWGFLFRVILVTTPAFWAIFVTVDLPWRVWVTRSIYHVSEENDALAGIDAKLTDIVAAHAKDFREIDARLENLPPQAWKDRIQKLEDWERENKADHLKILVALEAIKTRLSIPPPTPGAGDLPFYDGGSSNDQSGISSSSDMPVGRVAADDS